MIGDAEVIRAALLDRPELTGRILLTGPIGPDGDSLGACLALARILRRHGAIVDVAGAAGHRYGWIPGASELIADRDLRPDYDSVYVLDGDRHRLTPEVDACFQGARTKGIIDHHASTAVDGYDVAWVDPAASSTCEMLVAAFEAWGEALEPDVAELLYTGFVFDTGGFRYSSTTPETLVRAAALVGQGFDHTAVSVRVLAERSVAGLRILGHVGSSAELLFGGRLALCAVGRELLAEHGAGMSDLEGIVDGLVFTSGVEVAILLVEREGQVKVSLRSRDRVNVCAIAQSLAPSGGGHAKASGATIVGSVAHARAAVMAAVELELALKNELSAVSR
jgi:phosphoesterase RecJ-like protein